MNNAYENCLMLDAKTLRAVVRGEGNVVELQDASGRPLVCIAIPEKSEGKPFPHGYTVAEALNGLGIARGEKEDRLAAKKAERLVAKVAEELAAKVAEELAAKVAAVPEGVTQIQNPFGAL